MKKFIIGAAAAGFLLASAAGAFAIAPKNSHQPSVQTGIVLHNVGDWASHGCIPVTWSNGSDFNAWAIDTYPVHYRDGVYAMQGTFAVYCDPMGNNTGSVPLLHPVNGSFHGTLTWSTWPNGGPTAGDFTYKAGSWTFNETWSETQPYTEFESGPLPEK